MPETSADAPRDVQCNSHGNASSRGMGWVTTRLVAPVPHYDATPLLINYYVKVSAAPLQGAIGRLFSSWFLSQPREGGTGRKRLWTLLGKDRAVAQVISRGMSSSRAVSCPPGLAPFTILASAWRRTTGRARLSGRLGLASGSVRHVWTGSVQCGLGGRGARQPAWRDLDWTADDDDAPQCTYPGSSSCTKYLR